MSQAQTSTIYVADLPVSQDSNGQPVQEIDADFLRNLFQDQGILQSPDAITIKTKISRNGSPYSFAFIKFESQENAMNAISELNYTKLNNVPIRLIMADKETKMITRYNQGNLFIKNLDPEIEVSQLHDAFSNFGEIISCKIPADFKIVPKEDDATQTERIMVSRGYGYVQFRHQEDANQAMNDLKDASINGRQIEIHPFCRHQHTNPELNYVNCYIKNIPETYTDDDLKQLFEEFGKTTSCKVSVDENGKSKQFGFCCMETHDDAVKAVENLNGKEIDNFVVMCCRALSKQERQKELQIQSEKWRKANYEKSKGRNLYVRNFDEDVTDEELMKIFSSFGEVESAKVMRDETGKSKKFGFVCFHTEKEANECLKESTLVLIHDKQTYVAIAMPKDQRLKVNIARTQQKRASNNLQVNNAQNMMNQYQYFNPLQQPKVFPQQMHFMPFPQSNMQAATQENQAFGMGIPSFGSLYQNTIGMYNQDPKSMLRSEIMEKHPNGAILLQRLRDMSDEQAKELVTNQQLFIRWLEMQ